MKSKPVLNEVFADNGEHSHWNLINPDTGENLWSEDPAEDFAMGHPVANKCPVCGCVLVCPWCDPFNQPLTEPIKF